MEPERKIEKLLLAFAKKRRDHAGDSFKLHPATRRMLQNEVARRTRKPGDENFFTRRLFRLRPGLLYVACFAVAVFMAAALLLPGLNKAKSRSQMAGVAGNLKQIGYAAKEYAKENNQQLPQSLAEIQNLTGTNSLVDPASGKPFVYVAGGRSVDSLRPDSVLAYSPDDDKSRAVLFADGHVETVSRTRFSEITNRGLIQLALAGGPARREPVETPAPALAPAGAPTFSGGAGGGGGGGSVSKVTDLPVATIALNDADFAKNKIAADRLVEKKLTEQTASVSGAKLALSESGPADDAAAAKTKAVQPPPAAIAAGSVASKLEAAPPGMKLDGFAAQTDALSGRNADHQALLPRTANITQNFAQQTANNYNAQNVFKNASASAKATPVLANFQFQQNGSAVSVVDADGSVYNGYLVAASEAQMQNEPAELKRALKSPAPPMQKQTKDFQADKNSEPASENYFFRVAGTNRSLQQNVVFTGNFLSFSNVAQASSQAVGGSFNRLGSGGGNISQVTQKNLYQQSLISNSRIAGTAVVNNTNEIEINALPVTP